MSALLVGALAACSGSSAETPGRSKAVSPATRTAQGATGPYTGYPDSLVVLAHSAATIEDSGPHGGVDATSGSWATGTDPAVESIYRRILEHNPAIEGHARTYGASSATIADLAQQALSVVAHDPPDLVLIQAIDSDIVCPASRRDYDAFGAGLREVLDVFASQAPTTRVFVVTQPGTPLVHSSPTAPPQGNAVDGTGTCSHLAARGITDFRERKRLEEIIDGYEAQIPLVCDRYEQCSHDHGALSDAGQEPGDVGGALNHLSIQGHAHVAALVWKALQDAGLVPAG